MTVLEKVWQWIQSLATSKEQYHDMLGKIYIDPARRKAECENPRENCGDCEKNYLRKVIKDGRYWKYYE